MTAMVYVYGPAELFALSFTITLVSVTVPVVLGVPLTANGLPPVLVETLRPSVRLRRDGLVGTAVPLTVQV